MAVITDETWPMQGEAVQSPPDHSRPDVMTDEIRKGQINVDDANSRMVKEFSEKHGLIHK
jgi:hypothetical protein